MHLFRSPRNCSNKCNELDGESLESGPTKNETRQCTQRDLSCPIGSLRMIYSWCTCPQQLGPFTSLEILGKKQLFQPFHHLNQKNNHQLFTSTFHPRCYLFVPLREKNTHTHTHPHWAFHVCVSCDHWRFRFVFPLLGFASKTGTFVSGSWVLLWHLDDLCLEMRRRRKKNVENQAGGKTWPQTKKRSRESCGGKDVMNRCDWKRCDEICCDSEQQTLLEVIRHQFVKAKIMDKINPSQSNKNP